MKDLVITSRQNTIVKYVRGLRDKRTRETAGLFVTEGVKAVSEGVTNGIYPEKIIISRHGESQPWIKEILSRPDSPAEVVRVDDSVMQYMSETEAPQGILALFKMPGISLPDIRIRPSSVFVVVEGVQDPGNVGTIVRTADAFGAHAVILTSGCADLYNAKTLRSTMGSVFHIPVVRDVDISGLTAFLTDRGILTAVTSLDETSRSLPEADLPRPLAVVLGSETKGVSPEICRIAGAKLKIPMEGLAQSLNVAVAAGIVLYEAFRQKL